LRKIKFINKEYVTQKFEESNLLITQIQKFNFLNFWKEQKMHNIIKPQLSIVSVAKKIGNVKNKVPQQNKNSLVEGFEPLQIENLVSSVKVSSKPEKDGIKVI
jgi:hypothetical protein